MSRPLTMESPTSLTSLYRRRRHGQRKSDNVSPPRFVSHVIPGDTELLLWETGLVMGKNLMVG